MLYMALYYSIRVIMQIILMQIQAMNKLAAETGSVLLGMHDPRLFLTVYSECDKLTVTLLV